MWLHCLGWFTEIHVLHWPETLPFDFFFVQTWVVSVDTCPNAQNCRSLWSESLSVRRGQSWYSSQSFAAVDGWSPQGEPGASGRSGGRSCPLEASSFLVGTRRRTAGSATVKETEEKEDCCVPACRGAPVQAAGWRDAQHGVHSPPPRAWGTPTAPSSRVHFIDMAVIKSGVRIST